MNEYEISPGGRGFDEVANVRARMQARIAEYRAEEEAARVEKKEARAFWRDFIRS